MIQTRNHLVCKQTLKHLAKLAKCLSCVVSTYLYSAFDSMLLSCHDLFQSELTLYSCLNVKELLDSRTRTHGIRSHNHLINEYSNHLTKLAKLLSCVVSTYLYGAFDCMLLSCRVCAPK